MSSQTQTLTDPSSDQNSPMDMNYSSSYVVYIFLGQKPPGQYDNWVRMTRADLENVNTFKQALTRAIKTCLDAGMTHYYPYFGDVIM
ncbi:hypothetical protein J7T55_005321 [Diaporthe amygdali]|uniref:uncharacterized protein n=1 Tax=Phomopsis amygdali TaxID=1214568 RepID=UPI0022FF45B9|nr:uncharacterized protein J7T55_005321 [Diaporthe amygdali]KAJ0108344.1 hypothetical protein J7T55_005321 [Diaporthe amygdali]